MIGFLTSLPGKIVVAIVVVLGIHTIGYRAGVRAERERNAVALQELREQMDQANELAREDARATINALLEREAQLRQQLADNEAAAAADPNANHCGIGAAGTMRLDAIR